MKEMGDQFLPSDASWIARDKFKRLRQTSLVREYIKEFTYVILDIQNMFDEEKLYNFISGIQGWVKTNFGGKMLKICLGQLLLQIRVLISRKLVL